MYHIFFFFNDTATTEIYTLSLHDALPISLATRTAIEAIAPAETPVKSPSSSSSRSEEHTSELQSQSNIVCRLLLEKKNNPPHLGCGCAATATPDYTTLCRLAIMYTYTYTF